MQKLYESGLCLVTYLFRQMSPYFFGNLGINVIIKMISLYLGTYFFHNMMSNDDAIYDSKRF